ncbi:unnamed protein product [Parnassius apollo]|uniref:(apollo) hypothetical protein n=1 Tax=Parnassius apollo TaxID=110799 RepID=A0A8S3Y3G9_PARAO|nr:unnamed protein product [Parnassius apollo]
MIEEFAKEKVFWTRKMNLKLVYFIQSKPNIWNPKHPKYTSMEDRDQTYAEFAAQYGDKFTGQAVKNRWTNIRSTFANYLRKLNASRARGEEYKINWHLWKPCQFLMRVNRTVKDSTQNFKEENENNVIEKEACSSEDEILTNNTYSGYCKNIVESLVEVFKGIQNDPFGLDNTKYSKIGQLVTKKLSHMNSYEASKATKRIAEILLLYDESNPYNPNNNDT